jgi:serine-type D-Ala-D-Ala carboxypeptidase (penicillin-binding protein 5/6)
MRRRQARALLVGVPMVLVLLGAGAYVAVALTRAAPPIRFRTANLPSAFPHDAPRVAWPVNGQAAVEVKGIGLLGVSGTQRPVPIASVAKVMTALVVLRDHPLPHGSEGPEIPVTQADVAVYRADRAAGESVAKVAEGEELTERQALEALLLPSANNVATLLADWDAGSETAFVVKMNAQARSLGLTGTEYADASGFDPDTVSTARDQARLALAALGRRSLAAIVAMPSVTLPVAGTVPNRDDLLGRLGIVGIKTGNTSAAGACFVFASHRLVGGRRVTIVGAVLGQPLTPEGGTLLDGAFTATTTLLRGLPRVLRPLEVLAHHRPLGWVNAAWHDGRIPVSARPSRSVLGWPGLRVHVHVAPDRRLRAPLRAGEEVGHVVVRAGEQRIRAPLVLRRALPSPSLGWRLAHP